VQGTREASQEIGGVGHPKFVVRTELEVGGLDKLWIRGQKELGFWAGTGLD